MAKISEENSSLTREVSKFYEAKCLFITGAAGFFGSVLLETLLRCCPNITRIYILLRSKKNVSPENRKQLIFEKDIFAKLKESNPDVLKKVIVVPGDIAHENLGMRECDVQKLKEEVTIVFHTAATISFSKPILPIVKQNVLGTSNVIEFCRKLKKVEALVYTSSVYSCCNKKEVIDEKINKLPFSANEVVNLGRYGDEEGLMKLFKMCTPQFPNFYTFSKCVCENLLDETARDLPVSIMRPSIILCSAKGPLPGYLETGSAIMNLCTGVGTGFIRIVQLDKQKKIGLIYVDVVANAHVVAPFHQASKSLPSPCVYNCVHGKEKKHTWDLYVNSLVALCRKHPLPTSYLCVGIILCRNQILYTFNCLLFHYFPAMIIDLILWISGSKLRLMKIYAVYDKAMKITEYFRYNEWDMENEKFQSLSKELTESDAEMFFMDLKQCDLEDIAMNIRQGCPAYHLNGKLYTEILSKTILRYFLTCLYLCFNLGILFLPLYLVLFKIWP